MPFRKTYFIVGALFLPVACAPRTVEPVPGYPEARYDRTYASAAYEPSEVALVLDVVLAEPAPEPFQHAVRKVEIIVIDRDMDGWAADAFSKGTYISAGQGDARLEDAYVGSSDGERDRILIALRRPDGSKRPIDTHDFITHEFEHLRCFVLYKDADYNHSTAPGPWNAEDDERIVREDADLARRVKAYNDQKANQ